MKKFNYTFAIVFIFLSISACRFGTKTEYAPRPEPKDDPNADTITGYYQTEPSSLTVIAMHLQKNVVEASDISLIPQWISESMTNPVALILQDGSSGSSLLVSSKGTKIYMDTTATKDGKLSYLGKSREAFLWMSQRCTTERYVEQTGGYSQDLSKVTADPQRKISGRVNLKVSEIRTFSGDCRDDLSDMILCYKDALQCHGKSPDENLELQSYVKNIFDLHIKSGAISFEELPDAVSLSYEVTYE